MSIKRITILLPMYNEEKTAEPMIKIVTNILKGEKIPYEILVVNDGSTDKTYEKLKKMKKSISALEIVNHKTNMGLGAALQTGFRNANSNIIITMDADLTQDPAYIPSMLREIENGYDIVIGSRYVKGGGMSDVPFHRVLVSRFANSVFALLFGAKIKDMTSGFRCYKKSFVKDIVVENSGFSSQLEILIKCLKKRANVKEVPFVLVSRSEGESKFNLFEDAKKYFHTVMSIKMKK